MEDQAVSIAKLRTLTERQMEVLVLVSQGYLHKEIARRLHLSPQGVIYHLRGIYQKLGIGDMPQGPRRVELGKYCGLLPLLADPEPPALRSGDQLEPFDAGELGVPETLEDSTAIEERPNPDEPSQEALAIIRTLQAVIEDEAALAPPAQAGALAKPAVRRVVYEEPRAQRPGRRLGWLASALMILVSMLLGSCGTLLALQWRSGGIAAAPTLTTAPSLAAASAQPGALPTALAVTTPVLANTPAQTASVCGTGLPSVSAENADRFVRNQGVSLFEPDNTKGGVLSSKVRALAIDQRGLWIGYFAAGQHQGGIGQYDRQRWLNCNRPDGVAGANVNALAFDRRGRLWAATEKQGIAMFDGTSWTTYTTTNTKQLLSNETFGLTIDQQDHVWAATWDGIAKFDGSEWTMAYTADNDTIASGRVHAIAFDSSNSLWVGHIGGNDRIGGVSHRTADNHWHYYTKGKELRGNDVRSILVVPGTADKPETIWIATMDGGISTFAQGAWKHYQHGDGSGLPSDTIWMLTRDPLGRIWAGTSKGTAYFDGIRWVRYHDFNTLSIAFGPTCTACPFDTDQVWTGTAIGLTQSRLPPADERLDVDEICFELLNDLPKQRFCPTISRTTDVITASVPVELAPGDQFRAEITVRPRPPYQLRTSDFLSNTDADDVYLFKAHNNMPVKTATESGAPYTLKSPDTPFQAPPLTNGQLKQTFVSTWRMWMHTRYVGPPIRIQFTVADRSTKATAVSTAP